MCSSAIGLNSSYSKTKVFHKVNHKMVKTNCTFGSSLYFLQGCGSSSVISKRCVIHKLIRA